jgi:hypothetical protein
MESENTLLCSQGFSTFLDFKLSPCVKCNVLSFGCFPGVWVHSDAGETPKGKHITFSTFPVLTQINPVYTSIPLISDTLCNIIIPTTPRPSKWFLSFRLSGQNSVCIIPLPQSKLHVPSGSFVWIWSPEFFVMSSEASYYAVFSTHLLLADVHCKHLVVRTQAAVVLGVGSSFRPMWVISFTPRAYYLRG